MAPFRTIDIEDTQGFKRNIVGSIHGATLPARGGTP
jgi:hypothetical protein